MGSALSGRAQPNATSVVPYSVDGVSLWKATFTE
jgi:hypothetical protein